MIVFSIPVFLLMLGAAILGFLVSWAWIGDRLDRLQQSFTQQKEQFSLIQQKYQDLLEHSNAQHGDKEKLIQRIDSQQMKLAQFKVIKKQLEEDKQFLTKEFNAFRQKKAKNILPRQITGELASLKSQIDELTQEKENWREKYMIIRDANDEHLAKLSALVKQEETKEEEETLSPEESGNSITPKEKIDWREEYHQMQLVLNKKLDELKESKQHQNKEFIELKQQYTQELRDLSKNNEKLRQEVQQFQQQVKNDGSDSEL